ncbi:MAG: hypothetical protein NZL98_00210, partial [Anaerolineales bacterium]|nr:hypothetical protein [Anaerolineales bacterium]
ISASDFISYLRSRTLIKTAQNLEEISQNNLNRQAVLFSSSLTINDSNKAIFNNRSLVILVNGNLNISVNGSFLPENSNLAFLINGALAFSPSTAQAKGIFLANSVDTGATSNQGPNANISAGYGSNRPTVKMSYNRKSAAFCGYRGTRTIVICQNIKSYTRLTATLEHATFVTCLLS